MGRDITRYDEKWAREAEKYAGEEKVTGGAFISTRGGVLSFDDEELPGNRMCVVILDAVRENTYYAGKFDPDNVLPPVCYAFGRSDDEMEPHHTMDVDEYFEPQAESCSVCPFAEWGSSDTGRGKACSNRRRLALIPAGIYSKRRGSRDYDLELFDDPEHFEEADIAYLKLPVTSVKNWSQYVNSLNKNVQRPPYGVITEIALVPDKKSQFKLEFELIEEIDDELAEIIMDRHKSAADGIESGYAPPRDDDGARKGLKGLRKKRRPRDDD